uniref:Mitochondrial metalloendopeptidase OMA1 n=1 Tax=Anthurium amnicola TaxID=1678845 RepID=A0A1D1Y1G6_9ARAE
MSLFRRPTTAIRAFFRGLAPRARIPATAREAAPPVIPQSTLRCFREPVFFFAGAARARLPLPTSSPVAGFAGARRFYYVDRYQVQHFRRRGAHRWFENPRTVFLVVVVGSAGVLTVYYGNLETVPYTKRTHFVLLSPRLERQLGETQFEQLKAELKDRILPPTHPDSIRVRLIAKNIVEALQRGLQQHEHVWRDPEYTSGPTMEAAPQEESGDTVRALGWDEEGEGRKEERWSGKDEKLDDQWVQQSRQTGKVRGLQHAVQHLEGLNWEVVVVRNPITNAMCLPGGKIIVFTGLLDHFKSDAEIATVMGHEVGHAVARHAAEGITKNLWLAVLQLILYQFFALPDLINAMSNLLLKLPFSRRMEMEADYIGLLLLAAAGYDPRVAPKVYEKLGEITGDSLLRDYLSTHPSSKRRAEVLSRAHVMGEALAIYQEAIAGRGVEGFL